MVDKVLPHPAMVERLVALARRLRSLRRPKEAAELLEVAAALSPQGGSLRKGALQLRDEEGLEDFDRELKRRNLEASHALPNDVVFTHMHGIKHIPSSTHVHLSTYPPYSLHNCSCL